jgi:anti-sigma B factor antagonist
MREGTINDSREPRHVGPVAPEDGGYGVMGVKTDFAQAMQLELAYSSAADGSVTVSARGELDIATADQAYAYLRDVVDSQRGPLTVNLAGLTFCDAAGLGVLARLSRHARQAGRELKLVAARPSLLKIMRITGMDQTFPEVRGPALHMIAWPRQAAAAD